MISPTRLGHHRLLKFCEVSELAGFFRSEYAANSFFLSHGEGTVDSLIASVLSFLPMGKEFLQQKKYRL